MDHESKILLREQINAHPILELPPEEREHADSLKTELTYMLIRYFDWFKELNGRSEFPPEDDETENVQDDEYSSDDGGVQSARNERFTEDVAHERAMAAFLFAEDRAHKRLPFDSEAFGEALCSSLQNWSRDGSASFLTYFERVCRRQTVKSGGKLVLGQSAGQRMIESTKALAQFQRARGKSLSDLNEEQLELCARGFGMPRQSLESSCVYYAILHPASLDEQTDEDAPSMYEAMADPAAERMMLMQDEVAHFSGILESLLDLDEREYPRLFLSNSLLSALKQQDGEDRDHMEVARLMLRIENLLMRRVFIRDYLEFILTQPPIPDSIRNVILAAPRLRINDVAIALYKCVSKAAVSQQRKKYNQLLSAFYERLKQQAV